MLQPERRPPAPCPHCTEDAPPVSYPNGSFCDDLVLLAQGFDWPFESPTLVGLSEASRLVCSAAGPLTLASPRRPEPSWWLVRDGCAGLGRAETDGRFVERCRVGPGEWLDVTGALASPGRWAEDAVACGRLELLALPLASLAEACRADPPFAAAVRRVLQRRLDALPLGAPERDTAGAALDAWLPGVDQVRSTA